MSRVPGLDLLRAIAILWVMWSHAQSMGIISENDPVADYGWMGVDLFFVLSGYLIGGQLLKPFAEGRRLDFGEFYARRIFRILPTFWLVVLLYFAAPGFRERDSIQSFWLFLTFTENLFVDLTHWRAFSHVWSLCVEEQFYLVAPLLIWMLLRRPSPGKAVAACLAVLVGGMVLRGVIWMHDLAPLQGHDGFTRRFMERIYYPTWTRLDGLLAGLVLATVKTFRPGVWARLMARSNVLMLAGMAGLAISIVLFKDQRALLASVIGYPVLAAAMGLLVAAGASGRSLIGRWRVPGAGAIAAMAFSLYLIHKAAFHLVLVGLGGWAGAHPIATVFAAGAGAFVAGTLLHLLAERPSLWLRDRVLRRATPAEAAVEVRRAA